MPPPRQPEPSARLAAPDRGSIAPRMWSAGASQGARLLLPVGPRVAERAGCLQSLGAAELSDLAEARAPRSFTAVGPRGVLEAGPQPIGGFLPNPRPVRLRRAPEGAPEGAPERACEQGPGHAPAIRTGLSGRPHGPPLPSPARASSRDRSTAHQGPCRKPDRRLARCRSLGHAASINGSGSTGELLCARSRRPKSSHPLTHCERASTRGRGAKGSPREEAGRTSVRPYQPEAARCYPSAPPRAARVTARTP